MAFEITSGDVSQKDLEGMVAEEILSRKRAAQQGGGGYQGDMNQTVVNMDPAVQNADNLSGKGVLGGIGAVVGRNATHRNLVGTIYDEFSDIRNDPEVRAQNMDQMKRTYAKYLEQGNDPVELFIDRPGKNYWAAGQDAQGNDIVFIDSTAPHPAVMAHELGHVQMNHSNDPLSMLQRSGLGRISGNMAPILGAGGAILGHRLGGGKLRGSAIGGALGTVASSGNFAYELGGASGRAMEYLPDDVDQGDAYGDLLRAGMTYGMAGPGLAASTAVLAAGLARPEFRRRLNRTAGEAVRKYLNP